LDPWPLEDEGPRPKSGKSRLNLHGTKILVGENQLVETQKKEIIKGRVHDFEDPRCKLGFKEGVQLKGSICFK
jgi:hypothetical protein